MVQGIPPKAYAGALHRQDAGGTPLDPIKIETDAWYSWLEQHRLFYFEAGRMTFSARKEQRPGGQYWYAYRRIHGKLHTAYLGRSADLTLERLNATAEALDRVGDTRGAGIHQSLRVPGDRALPTSIPSYSPARAGNEQPRVSVTALKHNLPVQLTSLIGREHDSASVVALLQRPEVRLLTLTGPAGVGKTRLALQVASELLDGFVDGVYFVPLASIVDHDLVVPTIAQTLMLREVSDITFLDLLADYLQDKQLLLVLDNFEQVVRAAPLLNELLEVCLGLKLLVTSREVLHLHTEHQYVVPSLELPDLKQLPQSKSLSQYAAIKLFLQRAQAVKPDFQITPANARVIGEICSRLDGLPLALELASARIKHLSPKALLSRLEHRLSVLTSGAQDVPMRQQTLRNTIKWSYDLLDSQEQQLFRRLCVFVTGCTLETIEAICTPPHDGAYQVLDGVASLIDKSLVQQKEQEDGQPRFLMLETIREYGLEVLEASGEMETTRQAHAAYYLRIAEEAELGIRSPLQAAWLGHLECEHDNLRAALHWMLDHKEIKLNLEMALRLVAALSEFWRIRGYDSEGQTILEQALVASEGVALPVRANILRAAGRMALYQNDYERVEQLCEESLALFRELGDIQGVAHSLHYLGWAARERGNLTYASSLVEESLRLRRNLELKEDIVWSLLQCGILSCLQGAYARAEFFFEESLGLSREIGRPHVTGWSLYRLAETRFLSLEDSTTIHLSLDECLPLFRVVGEKSGIIYSLYLSARLALREGDAPLARSLVEQGLAISRESGERWSTGQLLSLLGEVVARQGDLAKARALCEESLALSRRADRKLAIASSLLVLAGVVASQSEITWAARLWGAAEAIREASGAPIPPVERADYERALTSVRAQLGEKTFAAAWKEGKTMTLEQVLVSKGLVTTIQQSTLRSTRPFYRDELTTREVEVLRLVARGMTDSQVADQLVISPRTVQGHLRSIYDKLNVSSRSAATRYAIEHKLV